MIVDRSVENKVKFAKRNSMIQNRFKIETGLLIDVVLQGKHNIYNNVIILI